MIPNKMEQLERNIPQPGEKYWHSKTHNAYEIIEVGLATETNECMIVYKNNDSKVFIRPLDMFMGTIRLGNKGYVYRFSKIIEE